MQIKTTHKSAGKNACKNIACSVEALRHFFVKIPAESICRRIIRNNTNFSGNTFYLFLILFKLNAFEYYFSCAKSSKFFKDIFYVIIIITFIYIRNAKQITCFCKIWHNYICLATKLCHCKGKFRCKACVKFSIICHTWIYDCKCIAGTKIGNKFMH